MLGSRLHLIVHWTVSDYHTCQPLPATIRLSFLADSPGIMELLVPRTVTPGSNGSIGGIFTTGLSLPGTFASESESDVQLSLTGTFVP